LPVSEVDVITRSRNQRYVGKMTTEKVGARAIILGDGQIGWKLGQWGFVHGRRVRQTLRFSRSAGAGSSEIPEVAARLLLGSLPEG
jgi:hypothetical protein